MEEYKGVEYWKTEDPEMVKRYQIVKLQILHIDNDICKKTEKDNSELIELCLKKNKIKELLILEKDSLN